MLENQNSTKFEFTQESILNLVKHTATREDIAALRSEMKDEIAKLDQKIESSIVKLDQRIESSIVKLDQKIDTSLSEFKRSMEAMEARMDRTEARMDRKFFASISIVLASAIALVGLAGHWLHVF